VQKINYLNYYIYYYYILLLYIIIYYILYITNVSAKVIIFYIIQHILCNKNKIDKYDIKILIKMKKKILKT